MNLCLQNSCSKELFGVIPGRLISVLEKNSTLDVSLESMQSMQKFSEQLFFKNTRTDAYECSNNFFLEHQWTPLTWWIGNRRELNIRSKVVVIPQLSTRMNINILFFFFFFKFSWQKYIFCNTVADDDADAEMPMPNGIDKKNLVAAS